MEETASQATKLALSRMTSDSSVEDGLSPVFAARRKDDTESLTKNTRCTFQNFMLSQYRGAAQTERDHKKEGEKSEESRSVLTDSQERAGISPLHNFDTILKYQGLHQTLKQESPTSSSETLAFSKDNSQKFVPKTE